MKKRIVTGVPCEKCGKLPAFRKRAGEVLCGKCGKGKPDVPHSHVEIHPNMKAHFDYS